MKNLLLPIALVFMALLACNSKPGTTQSKSPFPPDYDYVKLEGVYSGDFDGSIVYLNLRKVTGRNVVGYSLHRGVKRNVSGIMELSGNAFHIMLKEPGNNPYDGAFDIRLDTSKLEMAGMWSPKNNKDLKPSSFTLSKIVKNEDDYFGIFYDSLHTITFHGNGQCIFEFYNTKDSSNAKQMTILHGSWKRANNTYSVDWEPNDIYRGRMVLPIDSTNRSNEDYYMHYIIVDHDTLFETEM